MKSRLRGWREPGSEIRPRPRYLISQLLSQLQLCCWLASTAGAASGARLDRQTRWSRTAWSRFFPLPRPLRSALKGSSLSSSVLRDYLGQPRSDCLGLLSHLSRNKHSYVTALFLSYLIPVTGVPSPGCGWQLCLLNTLAKPELQSSSPPQHMVSYPEVLGLLTQKRKSKTPTVTKRKNEGKQSCQVAVFCCLGVLHQTRQLSFAAECLSLVLGGYHLHGHALRSPTSALAPSPQC